MLRAPMTLRMVSRTFVSSTALMLRARGTLTSDLSDRSIGGSVQDATRDVTSPSGHLLHREPQLHLGRQHTFEQPHLLLGSQRFYSLGQLKNLGGHSGHGPVLRLEISTRPAGKN